MFLFLPELPFTKWCAREIFLNEESSFRKHNCSASLFIGYRFPFTPSFALGRLWSRRRFLASALDCKTYCIKWDLPNVSRSGSPVAGVALFVDVECGSIRLQSYFCNLECYCNTVFCFGIKKSRVQTLPICRLRFRIYTYSFCFLNLRN